MTNSNIDAEDLKSLNRDTRKKANITVDVEELWHNTYIRGRKYANTTKTSALGRAHRATATLWNEGQKPAPLDSPSGRMFLSDDYGRFPGKETSGANFVKKYMPFFKKYFDSIKTKGYDPSISIIPIDLVDGEPYLRDGNRRIACIAAIGKQKEITVKIIENNKPWEKLTHDLAKRCLKTSYLKSEGKKVLYQPILHPLFDEFTTGTFKRQYRFASDTLLSICGNVEKKRVLDIGSCYGYYSFEFVRAGAYVTAVEQDGNRHNLAVNLNSLFDDTDWSNPLFIVNDIRKYIMNTALTFDYTLMMNVFHHIYAKNEAIAWDTLNRIAEMSGCILLTMSSKTPKNIGEQEDIPNLIIENTILNRYKDFGAIPPFGRHLFVFGR